MDIKFLIILFEILNISNESKSEYIDRKKRGLVFIKGSAFGVSIETICIGIQYFYIFVTFQKFSI